MTIGRFSEVSFFVGTAVLLFLVTFVVPNITKIFEEMHQTLPDITLFLISVSGFLKSFWWLLTLAVCLFLLAARYAIRHTEGGKYLRDKIKLKAPLIGRPNQKIVVARFSRTLGTLLESGGKCYDVDVAYGTADDPSYGLPGRFYRYFRTVAHI